MTLKKLRKNLLNWFSMNSQIWVCVNFVQHDNIHDLREMNL